MYYQGYLPHGAAGGSGAGEAGWQEGEAVQPLGRKHCIEIETQGYIHPCHRWPPEAGQEVPQVLCATRQDGRILSDLLYPT